MLRDNCTLMSTQLTGGIPALSSHKLGPDKTQNGHYLLNRRVSDPKLLKKTLFHCPKSQLIRERPCVGIRGREKLVIYPWYCFSRRDVRSLEPSKRRRTRRRVLFCISALMKTKLHCLADKLRILLGVFQIFKIGRAKPRFRTRVALYNIISTEMARRAPSRHVSVSSGEGT
ncbi:hypothetical protein EVAR_68182_1 [Eumeta japonica]|uniref:Uncharacterized protein n=1 Tax=Eumeta variegata TaxID=151549 RepID=A0A4C2A1P2_EUMVA|nr:hypothetical protein EVAR_68182_1 [Eumeta japonica]